MAGMKIFFVRHGETNYNILNLCNDDPTKNVHLTKLGKQQAKNIKKKMKKIKLDLVIISELSRTKETALIITENQQVKITVDPRINDRKTGYDSQPEADFFKALRPDKFNLKFNNGESFQEEKGRVFSFLEDLQRYNLKNILVVTHSEILKIIMGYFANLSDQKMWSTKIDNCQILKIELKKI